MKKLIKINNSINSKKKLIEKNTKGDKKDKNNGIEINEESVKKGKNKKGGCCGGQKE